MLPHQDVYRTSAACMLTGSISAPMPVSGGRTLTATSRAVSKHQEPRSRRGLLKCCFSAQTMRLRLANPIPASPIPSRARVPGSGTPVGGSPESKS